MHKHPVGYWFIRAPNGGPKVLFHRQLYQDANNLKLTTDQEVHHMDQEGHLFWVFLGLLFRIFCFLWLLASVAFGFRGFCGFGFRGICGFWILCGFWLSWLSRLLEFVWLLAFVALAAFAAFVASRFCGVWLLALVGF